MKNPEWHRFCRRRLQPEWPNTFVHRSGLYFAPVSWLLAGVVKEGTGRKNENYFWWTSMPLFIPNDTLVLSFGHRVDCRSVPLWWFDDPRLGGKNLEDELAEVMLSEGLPAAKAHPTLESFLTRVEAAASRSTQARLLEDLAYTQILLSRNAEAELTLQAAIEESESDIGGYQHAHDLALRVRHIYMLFSDSPSRAVEQLRKWSIYTMDQMRIPIEVRYL